MERLVQKTLQTHACGVLQVLFHLGNLAEVCELNLSDRAVCKLCCKASHLLGKQCERLKLRAELRCNQRCIYCILGRPSLQHLNTLLCNRDCHIFLCLNCTCTEVRCHNYLIEGKKR